jgi:MFS family permease
METFDELQSIWNKQASSIGNTSAAELMKKGEDHIKKVRAGHWGTIAIISVLVIALIAYFIGTNAYRMNGLTIGLTLMIVVMIVRVVLEWMSAKRFRGIKPDNSLAEYSTKMQEYYAWRKKMHTLFIPTIYALYIIGFTLLLPAFKANLSYGMYLYCVISGYGFLTAFALFLVRILRKEMKLLDFLKGLDS